MVVFRSNGPATLKPCRWKRSASTRRAPTVISPVPGGPVVARLCPAAVPAITAVIAAALSTICS